jgi:hypothetical protein
MWQKSRDQRRREAVPSFSPVELSGTLCAMFCVSFGFIVIRRSQVEGSLLWKLSFPPVYLFIPFFPPSFLCPFLTSASGRGNFPLCSTTCQINLFRICRLPAWFGPSPQGAAPASCAYKPGSEFILKFCDSFSEVGLWHDWGASYVLRATWRLYQIICWYQHIVIWNVTGGVKRRGVPGTFWYKVVHLQGWVFVGSA